MAVINLISPEQKRDIRAARINVILLEYAGMLLMLAAMVGLIYGLGFWLVTQDKQAVNEKLKAQSAQAKTFTSVEKEAEAFRQNLAIAKQILSKETSYSTFLTTLAADMPTGTVLTSFSIGGPVATPTKGMTLDARASSYAKVLELKNRLEQSSLFQDVNIVSATRPEDISKLSGQEARYPYEASFNVKLSPVSPRSGQ